MKLTKIELNFIERELKYIFECNYFKGNWEEFTQYSKYSKRWFDKKFKILNVIRKKIKKELGGEKE